MSSTVKHTPGEWRYSINYGPEGEANYANVYDDQGEFVSNLKTHHAIAVVKAMNSAPVLLEALKEISKAEFRFCAAEIAIALDAIAKAEGQS